MWKHEETTVKPLEIDDVSSNTVVYIRKNIVFVEGTDDKDAHYEFDEMIIPVEYYPAFKAQMATNDYLMMMVED